MPRDTERGISLSELALQTLESIDEEYGDDTKIEAAVILVGVTNNEDEESFYMSADSQSIWKTAGLVQSATLTVQRGWLGLEEDEDA